MAGHNKLKLLTLFFTYLHSMIFDDWFLSIVVCLKMYITFFFSCATTTTIQLNCKTLLVWYCHVSNIIWGWFFDTVIILSPIYSTSIKLKRLKLKLYHTQKFAILTPDLDIILGFFLNFGLMISNGKSFG